MGEKIHFSDRDIKITLYKQVGMSKNWYGSFQWNGKQRRFSCKTKSSEDAKKYCYSVIERLSSGGDVSILDKTEQTVNEHMKTFEEVFQSFLKYKVSSKSIQKTTERNYRVWGKNIVNFCGDWHEGVFLRYGIELYGDYLNYRKTQGREEYQYFVRKGKRFRGKKLATVLSGTTLNCELVLFHNILSFWKYDLGMLKLWDIPKIYHHKQPEKHEVTCPSKNEYIIMKEYWKSKNRPDIELWMRLASNTGMRPSEMSKLKVSDVDMKNKILYIRGRKSKLKKLGRQLDTLFPITERLEPILTDLIKLTEEGRRISKTDLLFVNPKTGVPQSFMKTWGTMLRNLKLDTRYTPKTMRKYFITKMVKESSIPLSIVASLVGHSNVDTLQKNYLHLRVDDVRDTLSYMYLDKERKKVEMSTSRKSNLI
jgi:integrase